MAHFKHEMTCSVGWLKQVLQRCTPSVRTESCLGQLWRELRVLLWKLWWSQIQCLRKRRSRSAPRSKWGLQLVKAPLVYWIWSHHVIRVSSLRGRGVALHRLLGSVLCMTSIIPDHHGAKRWCYGLFLFVDRSLTLAWSWPKPSGAHTTVSQCRISSLMFPYS